MARQCDVVVVGAGNAAMTAALSAHSEGASVCVLERASEALRGGNTYFCGGGYRFTHKDANDIRELVPDLSPAERDAIDVPGYTADDYFSDINRVTQNLSDPAMLETVVNGSHPTVKWLTGKGLKWELRTRDAVRVNGRLRWSHGDMVLMGKGGGAGRSDQYFEVVKQHDIPIKYSTRALKLATDNKGRVVGVTVKDNSGIHDITCESVILACGGFEASPEMRVRYLGPGWELVRVKGTKYNTGDGLKMAMQAGAVPAGHWSGCHCNPVTAEMPPFAAKAKVDQYNRCSYLYGIMVNVNARRFVDEGEDFWLNTYAKFGSSIFRQPDQTAFQIFDAKVKPHLEARYATGGCVTADTIEQLGDKLGLDVAAFSQTVKEFNRAVQDGQFQPKAKDGKRTEGITPQKSNWANKLDTPPFVAYIVVPGITFSFGGIKVNRNAQVVDLDDEPIPGLFAAGEMVGGLFYHSYCGGSGLMAGAVYGRIAGASAAASK